MSEINLKLSIEDAEYLHYAFQEIIPDFDLYRNKGLSLMTINRDRESHTRILQAVETELQPHW